MGTDVRNPADRRRYPSRWPMRRGKELFKEIDERSPDGSEELLSVSHITGITPRSEKNVTMFQSESLVGYKICRRNDIAANTMWTWQGAIGVSAYDGVISPSYNVYRQRQDFYNPRYLDFLLREPALVDVYYSLSTGIRPSRRRLYPEEFLTIRFPVPPRNEQDKIVRFLEGKLAEVDKLLECKQQELLLLQELVLRQFQDVSVRSITKVRLKRFVQLLQDFITLDPDATYVKTGMYNRGRGIFRREPTIGKDMGDSMFQEIHAGCVMISGQFAWEAATYITRPEDEAGVASHRYYLLKPSDKLSAEYIWCFLMSDYGQEIMKQCSHGAAGRNRPLNIKELLNVYVPIPSDEYGLSDLDRNVNVLMDFRKLLSKEEDELSALKSRIIADAVTGRMEVE